MSARTMSFRMRALITDVGAEAVIPCNRTRKRQIPYDFKAYKQRNLIERCFNKLEHFTRIAARYDRHKACFLAFLCIASGPRQRPAGNYGWRNDSVAEELALEMAGSAGGGRLSELWKHISRHQGSGLQALRRLADIEVAAENDLVEAKRGQTAETLNTLLDRPGDRVGVDERRREGLRLGGVVLCVRACRRRPAFGAVTAGPLPRPAQ